MTESRTQKQKRNSRSVGSSDGLTIGLSLILIFSPLARGSVQPWAITTIQLVTLAALILSGIRSIWNWQWTWIATPLDRPLIGLLILAGLSTAFSLHTETSMFAMSMLITYLIIFYVTIHVIQYRIGYRRLVYIIIGVAIFLAMFGLIKKIGLNPFSFWEYPELIQTGNYLVSTYGNRNHAAGYLEMALPLAIGMLMTGLKPGGKAFVIYLIGLLLAALILTLSRGGWISGLISLLFMACVLLKNPYYEPKKYLGFGLVAFVFLFLIILLNTDVVNRILTLSESDQDPSFQSRVIAWQACLKMIGDHPLLGVGPGMFSFAFTPYHPPGFSTRFIQAHNDYIHLVADTGIFLIPLIIWMMASLFRKGFQKLLNPSRLVRGTTIGAMTGMVAILIHSTVDFNLLIPANALLFAVLAAIVVGPVPGRKAFVAS